MDNTPKLKDQINKYLEILDKYDIKYLYHFTDISNLESIKKYGILSREFLDNHNIKYKPSSSKFSPSLDIKKGKLNYVKLSFNDGHPMIYHAKKYRNINPIFLKIKRDVILFADTLFSNMNSTDNNCISGDDFSTFSLIRFDIAIKHIGKIHPWELEKLGIEFDPKYITVESTYQGSKIFENGVTCKEIYKKNSSEAKKEIATQNDSVLLAFDFFGDKWPNKPYTAFYNWLYINALNQQNNIIKTLMNFDGYSDISFNPNKSINCQAYSCALYVALFKREILQDVISDKNKFLELMKKIEKIYYKSVNKIEKKENNRQGLF